MMPQPVREDPGRGGGECRRIGLGGLSNHNSYLIRDVLVACALGALIFLLVTELRRPRANVGRCDSLVCSFLWR
jgi:hypothetical protein